MNAVLLAIVGALWALSNGLLFFILTDLRDRLRSIEKRCPRPECAVAGG